MAESCQIMFRIALSVALLWFGSCKGELPDKAENPATDAVADTVVDTTSIADVGAPDAAAVDIAVNPDIPTPDTCPGGEGCPCTGNDTCDNGICLDTHEGKRCARACVDACQPGYSCQQYGSVDGAFFCVQVVWGQPAHRGGVGEGCAGRLRVGRRGFVQSAGPDLALGGGGPELCLCDDPSGRGVVWLRLRQGHDRSCGKQARRRESVWRIRYGRQRC